MPQSRSLGAFNQDDSNNPYSPYPNKWARLREIIREPAAEFLGTMILVLFGDGITCQVGRSQLQGLRY